MFSNVTMILTKNLVEFSSAGVMLDMIVNK